MFINLKKLILLGGDLVFLGLSLALALLLRYPQSNFLVQWSRHWPHFLVIAGVWLLIFYINGLYDPNLLSRRRKFWRAAINAFIASSLLSILYFYLNVQASIAPKTNLALFISFFVIFFIIWRGLFLFLEASFFRRDNLALIGFNEKTEKLLRELKEHPASGYQSALIFKTPEELENLNENLRAKGIKAIVVCDDFGASDKLQLALFNCLDFRVDFFQYPDFYEIITGKIPVETIGVSWFLENLREGRKNYFNFLKRGLDFLFALLGLLVSLPLWPLIALLIKLTSRGPVFFIQTRLGRQGQTFRIFKFRTMRQENNVGGPTLENDERITLLGSFLRKTRLDEIPQFLNILKNDMSFIGPRPERPEIAAGLEKQLPFYRTRLLIKPGLTGWDQISGKYHSAAVADSLEKLQYDLFYLKNRSLYLDLSITLRTIATVLSRVGR